MKNSTNNKASMSASSTRKTSPLRDVSRGAGRERIRDQPPASNNRSSMIQQQNNQRTTAARTFPDPLQLYASPTVDTLDDSYNVQTSNLIQEASERMTSLFSSEDIAFHPAYAEPMNPLPYTLLPKRGEDERKNDKPSDNKDEFLPPRPNTFSAAPRQLPISKTASSIKKKRRKKKRIHHDFQVEEDMMTVSIRNIDVSSRSAFEPTKLLSKDDWLIIASNGVAKSTKLPVANRSGGLSSIKKKLSPSLQHLELLHLFQNISTIRQLYFSPSVGLDSDIFVPWDDDMKAEKEKNDNSNGRSGSNDEMKSFSTESRSERRKRIRDGRYRSTYNPIKVTMASLPKHPPALSNRKRRLPMRSDVGFPNAPIEEIQRKQQEIIYEAEWEEASPRLIVLVTSGTLRNNTDNNNDIETAKATTHDNATLLQKHLRFNDGGLDGMPFAGRELIMSKERNERLFSDRRLSPSSSSNDNEDDVDHNHRNFLDHRMLRRTSVLAPPLDALCSSTVGWRPRPFHDRPPCMAQCLSCPISVNLNVGNIEPLICSLALYSLPLTDNPRHEKHGDATQGYGKMSEEFWFPAGEWKDLVNIESISVIPMSRADNENRKEKIEEDWNQRRHNALFSFDPMASRVGDVVLVLEVYKVAHSGDMVSPYNISWREKKGSGSATSSSSSSSLRGRIKSTLGGKYRKQEDAIDIETLRQRSRSVFKKFGTKLSKPLCFGVTPMFPFFGGRKGKETFNEIMHDTKHDESKIHWPNGSTQHMNLFAHVTPPESQDVFIDCLTNIVIDSTNRCLFTTSDETSPSMVDVGSGNNLAESALTSGITTDAGDLYTTSSDEAVMKSKSVSSLSKRSRPSRLFQSTKNSVTANPLTSNNTPSSDVVSIGNASIFSSVLDADFTQSMLKNPTVITSGNASSPLSPTLLVDAMGDCAIMTNPDLESPERDPHVPRIEKRSNLMRLPQSRKPSGYAGASAIREVLYLPPRIDKQYDVDSPTSYRSLLNLLYLYPRVLRFSSDAQKNSKDIKRLGQASSNYQTYTVRIRLLKNVSGFSDDNGDDVTSYEKVESFHNQAPWSGAPLLDEVYTKLTYFESVDVKKKNSGVKENGIHMRDEIKIRLPAALDGNYLLQFSLCEVELASHKVLDRQDCGVSIRTIAESLIPLSSSSSREVRSGVRIATVIPNGRHRLKLGDFQLELETRLVSAIHVSDAAVATALRDFPYAGANDGVQDGRRNPPKALALTRSKSSFGRTSSFTTDEIDEKVPFINIFAAAADSSVLSHFPLLVYMHLCNMVNRDAPKLNIGLVNSSISSASYRDIEKSIEQSSDGSELINEEFLSFLEIIHKAKQALSKTATNEPSDRVALFLKNFVDCFDENLLSFQHQQYQETSSSLDRSGSIQSRLSQETPTHNLTQDDIEKDLEDLDGDVVTFKSKASMPHEKDLRISQSASAIGISGKPLSRVAYGASKIDRMKIEAEMYRSNGRNLAHLEDDETVVTVVSNVNRFSESDNILNGNLSDDDETIITYKSLVPSLLHDASKSIDDSLAKRVKNAAKVLIAPCMTPTLDLIASEDPIYKKGQSIKRLSTVESGNAAEVTCQTVISKSCPLEKSKAKKRLCGPSSDVEDNDLNFAGQTFSQQPKLRGLETSLLVSSVLTSKESCNDLNGSRTYLYEIIVALWLRTWVNFSASKRKSWEEENQPIPSSFCNTFLVPKFDPSKPSTDPIFSFIDHMDILLPLCLKSLILRISSISSGHKMVFDDKHMMMFNPFVEVLARGLMGQALSGDNCVTDSKESLLRALSSTHVVLDFIIGLFTVVHPQQVSILISTYFKALRKCETENMLSSDKGAAPSHIWSEDSLRRVRSSRQLRIRSVEILSVLPSFLQINYPLKWSDKKDAQIGSETMSWTSQAMTEGSLKYNDHRNDTSFLPRSGWLADLLVKECLLVCSVSCEALVSEAMAKFDAQEAFEKGDPKTSSSDRFASCLKAEHLFMFQSTATHAITCMYELLLRRHTMDERFQSNQCRGRIAAVLAPCILEKSLSSVRLLARMESTHEVRSLWLLSFVYVLQEAPEIFLRERCRSYCKHQGFLVHRFIRLLRLSSSTFQYFVDLEAPSNFNSIISCDLSSWLMQESFNVICASLILLVDECAGPMSLYPREQNKMAREVLDLLLHVIAAPQSSVTHLRAIGGALQAITKFGIELFLEVTSDSLQNWIRVVLALMNSTALSVRTMATDFCVSLLGEAFRLNGNIDELALVFVTLTPEVVAREIGLYSVNGLITKMEDIEKVVWPLRRALADIEDANPLDDDRVDPQLSPVLSFLCRACQAAVDGVLIELRLSDKCEIIGSKVFKDSKQMYIFDADEESLFEAANFFLPETGAMQRVRWLQTLTSLHEAKGHYLEAAETLMLCAQTLSNGILHAPNTWRPSRFELWYDNRRSLWLSSIGRDGGPANMGNAQVMNFANSFLEPPALMNGVPEKIEHPTLLAMCGLLIEITKEAILKYMEEPGTDEIAYDRLEFLLKAVMKLIEDHGAMSFGRQTSSERKKRTEEHAALQRVSATLSAEMRKFANRVLSAVDPRSNRRFTEVPLHFFARIHLSGKKPKRFMESTTIPTFLEWGNSCVVRIPLKVLETVKSAGTALHDDNDKLNERICVEYMRPIYDALVHDCGSDSIICRIGNSKEEVDDSKTTINISIVQSRAGSRERSIRTSPEWMLRRVKQFFLLKKKTGTFTDDSNVHAGVSSNIVEMTVAHAFPCALSRQRTLLTTEIG